MGKRIYERLFELVRAELTARVWVDVPAPEKWSKDDDAACRCEISNVLFVSSGKYNEFAVADQICVRLRAVGHVPNAVQVIKGVNGINMSSSLLYEDWP